MVFTSSLMVFSTVLPKICWKIQVQFTFWERKPVNVQNVAQFSLLGYSAPYSVSNPAVSMATWLLSKITGVTSKSPSWHVLRCVNLRRAQQWLKACKELPASSISPSTLTLTCDVVVSKILFLFQASSYHLLMVPFLIFLCHNKETDLWFSFSWCSFSSQYLIPSLLHPRSWLPRLTVLLSPVLWKRRRH